MCETLSTRDQCTRSRCGKPLLSSLAGPLPDQEFSDASQGPVSLPFHVVSPQLLELLAFFYYEFTELEVHVCIQFMFLLARWALVCCYLGRTFVYVCGHFTFWTQFCLPAAWVSGHRARSLLALSFYQGDSFPLQPHCPAGVIRLSGPGSTSFSWFPGGLGRHWRCLYCLQAQQLQTCSSRVQLSGEKLAGQL